VDACLTEWYQNDAWGLGHGYTIRSRPERVDGDLILNFTVRGFLQPRIEVGGSGVGFADSLNTVVLHYSGLAVIDVEGRSLPAHFEPAGQSLSLYINDSNAHYPISIHPVVQQAYLKASHTGSSDQFGFSVSVPGEAEIAGAYQESSNATGVNGNQSDNSAAFSGAAYVFVRNRGVWSQQAWPPRLIVH
jgi:hypothetical protein